MCRTVNMGWSTGNSFEADGELEKLPNFRIFRSAREHWHEPLKENRDRLACWKLQNRNPQLRPSVAYYFGKTLQQNSGTGWNYPTGLCTPLRLDALGIQRDDPEPWTIKTIG